MCPVEYLNKQCGVHNNVIMTLKHCQNTKHLSPDHILHVEDGIKSNMKYFRKIHTRKQIPVKRRELLFIISVRNAHDYQSCVVD